MSGNKPFETDIEIDADGGFAPRTPHAIAFSIAHGICGGGPA
jgi:hypothetical protein